MRNVFLCLIFILWNGASVAKADFTFNDFSSASLNLIGSTAQNGSQMRLTTAVVGQTQVGGMWFNSQQSIKNGFDTTFQFRITRPYTSGADGFAFVIQNDSSTALGGSGGGIGYGGIKQRIAIEFDTYKNLGYPEHLDPSDNHVSIQRIGVAPNEADHANSLGCTSDIPMMTDGNIHTVDIKYDSGIMKITFDGSPVPNLQAVLRLEDYMTLNGNSAWVGFTATTGPWYDVSETHDILNWSFQSVPEPTTLLLLGLGGLLLRRKKK